MSEFNFMALALPGSRGLFCALQFRFRANKTHIRLARMVHDFLHDFCWIPDDLGRHPRRIYEIIPTDPQNMGTTDAPGFGWSVLPAY